MSTHNQSVFEDTYNENELESMVEALQDAMYKLESLYNSDEDRNDIMWTLQQLSKIESLLIHLQNGINQQ
jgi:hypothetical protein